jgi:hypothetical protein
MCVWLQVETMTTIGYGIPHDTGAFFGRCWSLTLTVYAQALVFILLNAAYRMCRSSAPRPAPSLSPSLSSLSPAPSPYSPPTLTTSANVLLFCSPPALISYADVLLCSPLMFTACPPLMPTSNDLLCSPHARLSCPPPTTAVGIIYARVSEASSRSAQIIFSDKAAIRCVRGKACPPLQPPPPSCATRLCHTLVPHACAARLCHTLVPQLQAL